MATFKNIVLLTTTLLGAGVSASAIDSIVSIQEATVISPVPQPLELINGPVKTITYFLLLSFLPNRRQTPQLTGPSHIQGGNLTENATGLICQPTMFQFAVDTHMIDGINYLKGRDGHTEFGWQQGGGLCTRVSCEENSGIYVCNDNEFDVWVYYDVMAAYAQYIMDYTPSDPNATVCSWMQNNVDGSVYNKEVTAGQLFDNRGWNVVVGMADDTNC
ncbi:hypothetical protein N0V82_010232 [Gnomoniopsis sp. IMI 355080]|nr:hypothetical protein N0V82_010232 [Gnomoniopsis sp. IMI 355080]